MGDHADARAVLAGIVASIEPAREEEGELARLRVLRQVGAEMAGLGALARRLVAARGSARPRVEAKAILVCAADHGVAGAEPAVSPTAAALRFLASGAGALGAAARRAGASVVLVDCGVRGGDRERLGPGVLSFRIGDGTGDVTRGPAMAPEDARASVQTGVALVYSLAEAGLDLLALGQLGGGAAEVSGALVCALAGTDPGRLGAAAKPAAAALEASRVAAGGDPLEILAAVGGYDLGVLAGAILGAASIRVPVVLDDHATSAAALVAARMAPAAAGYLITAHGGGAASHRLALEALGLAPLVELGLSSGEGTGAALALPMIEAAARVLAEMRLE